MIPFISQVKAWRVEGEGAECRLNIQIVSGIFFFLFFSNFCFSVIYLFIYLFTYLLIYLFIYFIYLFIYLFSYLLSCFFTIYLIIFNIIYVFFGIKFRLNLDDSECVISKFGKKVEEREMFRRVLERKSNDVLVGDKNNGVEAEVIENVTN